MVICDNCGHHERYHDEAIGCVGGPDHCGCEAFFNQEAEEFEHGSAKETNGMEQVQPTGSRAREGGPESRGEKASRQQEGESET